MSIKDRVALVTGGGRGVGKGISLSLAAAGASVAVNYRRDEESAAETVREIEALGGKAIAFSASVDDYEQNARMVADIERDLGPVSILVNNAGIASIWLNHRHQSDPNMNLATKMVSKVTEIPQAVELISGMK